jgi:hypothetical protein
MVREHGAEHPSQWAAIASIASKLGCTPETLRPTSEAGRESQSMAFSQPRRDIGQHNSMPGVLIFAAGSARR